MSLVRLAAVGTAGVLLTAFARPVMSQDMLAPVRASGQTVTPVFEGWYRNPDGSFSISFGYFNRNGAESLDIPIGAANNISPGGANQGQPTRFEPRRHWGVFAIKVPSDFGDKKVTWTLTVRGETYTIAGSMRPQWEIDALQGEAGSGNTPPVVKFAAAGPEGRGPGGIMGPTLTGKVGIPVGLTVWANDDGAALRSIASEGRRNAPVNLMWFKHQGPGDVTFAERAPKTGTDGMAQTTATFTEPGEYILRVRANDASGVDNAGHAQCCWTNGFVKVRVDPQ
jgi:hypothetical protein